MENVPLEGGVIIAPNHISFADPPLMGITLPRKAWFIATDELFAYPIMGPLARAMHGFPIRQDSPDRAAMRRAEALLKNGEVLVLFPEGHVSKTGELQPLQRGVILIAFRANVPIVPVAVIGTNKMNPPHTWKIHHAGQRMIVRFGKPLNPEELAGGLKGRAALDHGTKQLTIAINELLKPSDAVISVPSPAREG